MGSARQKAERIESHFARWWDQDDIENQGYAAHSDDVSDKGIFVMGQGSCGRVPVDALDRACQRGRKAAERLVVRHVG